MMRTIWTGQAVASTLLCILCGQADLRAAALAMAVCAAVTAAAAMSRV